MTKKTTLIQKNTLYFFMMNQLYFDDYSHLDEFQDDLNRGHGVMILDINNLIIGIPLRSNLKPHLQKSKHLFPYGAYVDVDGEEKLKALDFSKTTIIETKYINTTTNYIFKDENEKAFYLDNFSRISLRLKNYIEKYISICKNIERGENVAAWSMKPYRYTTLINFHKELGINTAAEEVKKVINNLFY